jgi:hypothetical protein
LLNLATGAALRCTRAALSQGGRKDCGPSARLGGSIRELPGLLNAADDVEREPRARRGVCTREPRRAAYVPRMSTRVFAFLAVLLCAARAFGAEVGIEFAGVMGASSDVRVALTNKASGSTQWVPLGATFAGYTVTSYDAKTDMLVVAKDGQQFRLPLKQAKVVAGAAKPPAQVERAILNNLRQLAAAADQYYLENGKTSATCDDLVGPTKYVKSLTSVDGENYRALQFAQGKPLVVTTSSGYSISYSP